MPLRQFALVWHGFIAHSSLRLLAEVTDTWKQSLRDAGKSRLADSLAHPKEEPDLFEEYEASLSAGNISSSQQQQKTIPAVTPTQEVDLLDLNAEVSSAPPENTVPTDGNDDDSSERIPEPEDEVTQPSGKKKKGKKQ